MATRELLAELASAYSQQAGVPVAFESVGGVDAARRVGNGEAFDIVVLAADAIDKLAAAGHVIADSTADLARSNVAIAVRAGGPMPDVDSEEALRRVVMSARAIGYSTGPSGAALLSLIARWGIAGTVRDRMVQAPAGVPVGKLVASGDVELGFQQLSELMHLDGIAVLGTMPPGAEIVTTFSAGVCAAASDAGAARAFVAYLASPGTAEAKRRHGMEPA